MVQFLHPDHEREDATVTSRTQEPAGITRVVPRGDEDVEEFLQRIATCLARLELHDVERSVAAPPDEIMEGEDDATPLAH